MSFLQKYAAVVWSAGWLLACSQVAKADDFSNYELKGSFILPAGTYVYDVLPNGRLLALVGAELYQETSAGSRSFELIGVLPEADIPSWGAAFLRVSPDGQKIAVGNNGPPSGYKVGVFDLEALLGNWFAADHYDAEWFDNTTLMITAAAAGGGSIVTALDSISPDPNNPDNPILIDNIGGASGGVTFDSVGNLYTGSGSADPGPSGTGWVKYFEFSEWSDALAIGYALDFESEGTLVVDLLSATTLGFDSEGNLHVGGGDFSGDYDYAALVRASAIESALSTETPVDPLDPQQVRKFDPEPDYEWNYYILNFNPVCRELYLQDYGSTTVYIYRLPSPFASEVIDYSPAPGQYVNNELYNDPTKALGRPYGGGTYTPNNDSVVTLGGFGGSIILAFDHTVLDDPLNPMGLDAIVYGNAFWVNGNPNEHWAECGYIEISRDLNGSGQHDPDEPWYLIPGSHITDPSAQYDTQTWDDDIGEPTYPPPSASWIPPGYIGTWTTSGFLLPGEVFNPSGPFGTIVNPYGLDATEEGIWGYAGYAPTLILGDLDVDNVADDLTVTPEQFYTWPDDPYMVGITAGSGGGDAFDIAWAIDPDTGDLANLDGFDFIRITTGVNYIAGLLGEVSPEIDAVADVAPDCNENLVPDWLDISSGTSSDVNGNAIPDECECILYGDVDGSGEVDVNDLLCVLDAIRGLFTCPGVTFEDLDIWPCEAGNGDINLNDLLAFLDSLRGLPPCPDECP